MEFRLFGGLAVQAGDQLLDVGTPRQQAVLAALLVDVGRPVAIETLIDRVWGDAPPVAARNVLYSHLSRIRQLLRRAETLSGEAAPIERRHAGYLLDVDPDLVDLHRFWRLVEQGSNPKCADADRAVALTEALDLWRGTPLAGIAGEWVEQVRGSWQRRRLDAVVQWGQVELRLGHPGAVITVLPDLVAENPLAEPLEGLLMRALHAAGRDAEAIARYTAIRRRLADELGADPGAELRALHQAILRGELRPPVQATAPAPTPTAPAQLPADVPAFAGRDEELRHLDGLVAAATDRPTSTVIVAVSGTAGVGKTALAVHWAHRVRDEFPDGQLYVNLRGFDPTGPPVTPADAVRGLVDAFGVPPERIPAGFEAQIGLYRSLLATRRVLVVLDNARDAEQVRPLRPGAPGCLVVVTSRDQLSGLVAEGAQPITLDLLTATEARELLARRLGPDRVAAEQDAAAEIVTLCARLPLALAVVAARAATHPGFSLAGLVGELRETRGGLDEFAGVDRATDTRTVFSWSYLQLTPAAAMLFRLLGLHPGPDVATRAAASLAGLPVGQVRPLLAELARANLVAEHSPGRYSCHDLLRAYATEQAHLLDSETDQRAAISRVLGHYVHTADSADRLLNPHRDDPPALPPSLPPGIDPERMADHAHALAWFDAERRVLLAAIRQVTGFDAEVWHLAWALRRFLSYQGHWRDSIDALSTALDAARRLADPLRQAYAHCFLGSGLTRFGRYEEARAQLEAALDLYHAAGDEVGEATAHHYLSLMLERQGRPREALPHAQQSLDLFRSTGHRAGQAKALNAIGWFHALLGDYEAALDNCQQALDLQDELGDVFGQADTWHSLGYAHHHLGRHALAITCYHAALERFRELDYRDTEAIVLASIGDTHFAAGDPESAGAAWREACDLLDQLGLPLADEVHAKLRKLKDPRPQIVS